MSTLPSKYTVIVPIYSMRSKRLPTKYWPVSLNDIPSKTQRICKQPVLPIDTNKIPSPAQFDLLRGSSCIINNQTVMDSLTKSYRDELISHELFVRWTKAFDRIRQAPTLHWPSHGSGRICRGFLLALHTWPDVRRPTPSPYMHCSRTPRQRAPVKYA